MNRETFEQFAERFMNGDEEQRSAFMRLVDGVLEFLRKTLDVLSGKKSWSQVRALQKQYDMIAAVRDRYFEALDAATRQETQGEGETRYSLVEIVGESGRNYGIGVYLDSTLLEKLTEEERIEMVKEYLRELGGSVFTAYDSNGNEVEVRLVEGGRTFRNARGKRSRVNQHLTGYLRNNPLKQEAISLVDELIITANQRASEPAHHSHGWLDNNGQNAWDVWATYIQDKENTIWEATLQIANSADGEKVLYEIHPIKKVERSRKSAAQSTNDSVTERSELGKRNSVKDNDYLSAVESGDMVTAQRIEDEINAIQNIGRISVNSFSSSDIAKTERYARRYWETLGVKSPFFRAWFGDWRVNDKTPIQIANRRGENTGVQKNDDTGWDIQVSSKVFNETKSHNQPFNVAARRFLPYINNIVENAVLLNTYGFDPKKIKSPNSLLMHSFYAVVDVGEGAEVVKLLVEEMYNPNSIETGKRAYQLQDIQKYQPQNRSSQRTASSIGHTTGTIRTIADLVAYVKSQDEEFAPNPASKIVDTNGRPKVMYHGSPAQFTVFDKRKARSSGLYGRGFYFTDSDSHASTYGNTYRVYLDVKNPLQFGVKTVSKAQVKAFLEAVAENEDYSIENYGTYDVNSVVNSIMGSSKKIDVFRLIQDVSATAIGDMVETVKLFNTVNGTDFDGIIVPTETVVFRPEQIKSATDNVGTFDKQNPDIRYSAKDTEVDIEALQAENTQLRAANAELAAQMKRTEGVNLDERAIRRFAKKLIEREGSTFDADQLANSLSRMYDYMVNTEDMTDEDAAGLIRSGTRLARQVLEQARYFDQDSYDADSAVREFLRDTGVEIPVEYNDAIGRMAEHMVNLAVLSR